MRTATRSRLLESAHTAAAGWRWAARVNDLWWTRYAGRVAIEAAGRRRFDALVAFARARSPLYRELYRHLPERPLAPAELPAVSKRMLMARFDDWVTAPGLTRAGVEAFLTDRTHIGERYLDRYVIWTSSGTTGVPGIYVQDDDALATFDALMAAHVDPLRFAAMYGWPLLAAGGRAALVAATGEHFASIASWERVCRGSPWISARGFSIMEPLPRIVAALNAYRPAFLASYPSMLALLADERAAGRLTIAPVHLWSGGERLPAATQSAVERAFGCRLINEYGASECMSIAYGCRHGALHVNAEWVLLEPVERDGRPTPPGQPSHTVLLTNLANRVQPIIRYDLGDSVVVRPAPCACGSPLPAIEVEGRHDDIVALRRGDGTVVRLLPLALTTVVEEAAGVHRFQIAQTGSAELMLRFAAGGTAQRHTRARLAQDALHEYLVRQGLPEVRVGLDRRAPVADRPSGKLREVIVVAS